MNEISETLKQLLDELVKELKANIPNATGKTSQSLEVKVEDKVISGFGITSGKILANKYFGVLESGRRPGKMPPIQAIKEWVEAKSFNFPFTTSAGNTIRNADSMSWAIAIKISNEGTKLFRQGGHSGVISNVLSDQRLDTFSKAFFSKTSRVILNNILTRIKKA